MNTSENINDLAAALSAAQGELENADKNKKGYGYDYADLAQILDIIRPVFAKHGLSVIQLPHNQDAGIAVTTRLCHSSGQWIEETLVMPAEKAKNLSLAQSIGVSITYSRRYMLSAVAGITQDDPDAKGETEIMQMPGVDYSEKESILAEAAAQGVEAMQKTWFEFSAAEKKALVRVKEKLKKVATAADLENAGVESGTGE